MKVKMHEDSFRGDACVYYGKCGDGFVGVYICQKLLNCTL